MEIIITAIVALVVGGVGGYSIFRYILKGKYNEMIDAARKEAEVAAKEEQERINTLPADVVVHVYWDCDDCQDMYGYSAHAYLEPTPPMEGNKDREYYYERRDFEEDSILLDKCDIFLNKFTMYDGIPQQTIIDDKVVKFIQH